MNYQSSSDCIEKGKKKGYVTSYIIFHQHFLRIYMIESLYRHQFSKMRGKKAEVGGDIGTLGFNWELGPYLVLDNPDTGSPTRNIFPGEEVVIGGERYLYMEGNQAGNNGLTNDTHKGDSSSLF